MYLNWFVVQVTVRKEQYIKQFIEEHSDDGIVMKTFSKEVLHKKQGNIKKVINPLFPGYIFIQRDVNKAVNIVKSRLKNEYISPVCLQKNNKSSSCSKSSSCFTDGSPCMVHPDEMEILLENTCSSGLFKLSYAYKKGEEIIILKGPLKNLKGKILFFNEKKKRAGVELCVFKRMIKTTLGVEFITKPKAVLV